jgi:hypothetical protein
MRLGDDQLGEQAIHTEATAIWILKTAFHANPVRRVTPTKQIPAEPRVVSACPEDGPWLVVVLPHPAALSDAAGRAGADWLAFDQDTSFKEALLEAFISRETSLQRLEIPDPRKVGSHGIHGLEGMEQG